MKPIYFTLLATPVAVGIAVGCAGGGGPLSRTSQVAIVAEKQERAASLVEARKGFKTKLAGQPSDKRPAPKPPARVFRTVQYESPAGNLTAYLTPDPKDGKKHPAIIWITGGDCNSIDEGCWKEGPASNDQSASAYRKARIVMMFPSLRGGNDNPGNKEGFLGEVDDVIAAADYLSHQPYVDSNRIYLGGHSTGGTTVLLAAECSDRFRAVFSFGPVHDVSRYPGEYLPFDRTLHEIELRSPGLWLGDIKSPTFVFEGTTGGSNIEALRAMAKTSTNANVHFVPISGADHFTALSPTNRLIAAKILRDDGPTCNLSFTEAEVSKQ
jgi:acetyl esterase/lipase